jgi:two-component system chemotaxis sensor kinase CheA
MVILTDITEKHLLEEKLEQERSILKMGVKVVANHTDFVNAVCDYKDFCENRIDEILGSDMDTGSMYAEVFRSIHTFKGTFAQLDMKHIAQKLHDFETTIDHFIRVGHDYDNLKGLLETNRLEEWLDEDFDILREVLGERYLKLDKLVVTEESKLKEIEDKILEKFQGDDAAALVKELRKLRYRSIKEMLGHYPQYCARLSERLEKPIGEFEVQGTDTLVDPDIYSGLCKAMVHIFRNVMDHGIETAEERISKGKSELGRIACNVAEDGKSITISVSDDGAGIDFEKIKQKAADDCIMSAEEASAAAEEDMIQMLYTDGFTTADEVTELSGRGVGLPAVKAEVENLKGTISIETEKGKGTCFRITVPLLN